MGPLVYKGLRDSHPKNLTNLEEWDLETHFFETFCNTLKTGIKSCYNVLSKERSNALKSIEMKI